MADEQTNHIIDNYLNGLMSDKEKQAFDERLAGDAELAKEVALQKEVMTAVAGEKIHELRSVLKSVDQQWGKENAGVIPFTQRFRPFLVAATVLLLVAIGLFWFLNQKKEFDSQELFASNFEPYQMVLNKRSQDDSLTTFEEMLNSAINTYSQGNFTESADFFDQVLASDSSDVAFLFYQGITLLASDKASEAVPFFQKVAETEKSLFSEQAQWYLGLAYLKDEDLGNARRSFEGISEGAFQYEKAQGILVELP